MTDILIPRRAGRFMTVIKSRLSKQKKLWKWPISFDDLRKKHLHLMSISHFPLLLPVYIANWKIIIFNGKFNYFYGHFQ